MVWSLRRAIRSLIAAECKIGNERREPSVFAAVLAVYIIYHIYCLAVCSDDLKQEINLPLMQKIKMIDLALANKRMKDNLQTLIAQ